MNQTNLQLEFLQRVYALRQNTNSIATTVQAWLSHDEIGADYGEQLSKSPLAQKIVHDLKFRLWYVAFTWECEMDYDPDASIQALEDIGNDSFESSYGGKDDSYRDPDYYAMDLQKLKEAAQIATEVLTDIFEHYFFMLPSDSPITIPDTLIPTLDRLQRDLPHKLYWLQRVLAGYVIKTNTEQACEKFSKKPISVSHKSHVR